MSSTRRRPGAPSGLVWRIFASYLLVVAVVALAALVAGEALAPYLLDRHMRAMGDMMSSSAPMAAMADDLARSYRSALRQSIAWAVLVATVVAAAVAWAVTGRLVAPLAAMRAASRAIADGRYADRLDASAPGEIGDLAASFNTMAGALEQSDASRRRLLTDLAHELRTPLSNLRGYVEALEDGVFTLDAATGSALRRQVERIERLTDDLSLLHRLESEALPIRTAPLALRGLIDQSVAAFRARFDDKRVRLVATVPADLMADADAARTTQVLENLLANALRFTAPGGTVEVHARAYAAAVAISVRDTGPGVPAEEREAIFRRLVRGDPARGGATGQGSGVGLTIAKALVTRQGGEIWVQDADGGGADFTFTLPRAVAAPPS
jgi:two-component system, OmpR family, sensor histidine kinase BaeS